MAVIPCQAVLDKSVPSKYKPSSLDLKEPNATLELEYIYGYWCHDVRNNLRYVEGDKFAYMSAAVGIIMDPTTNT